MVYQTIDAGNFIGGLGLGIFFIISGIILIILTLTLIQMANGSISKRYRKYLTNLYVAGRIRQLADKDQVDLKKEEKEVLKYESLSSKKVIKDLDDKIEAELVKEVEKYDKEKEVTK